MIDCMTCLVRLAQGCPTTERTVIDRGVTCAEVRSEIPANKWPTARVGLAAHKFVQSHNGEWYAISDCGRYVVGWPTRDQT